MNEIIGIKEKELIELIKSNKILIRNIPEEFRTEKIYCECVKHNIHNFNYIPKEKLTLSIILEAAKINGCYLLRYLEKEKWTPEIVNEALKSNGMALNFIPKSEQTLEQCLIALKQKIWSSPLRFVSKKFLSKELCIIAAENSGDSLEYIPEKFLCHELYQKAFPNNRFMLDYLPSQYKTEKFYEELVCNDGLALEFVPKKIITKKNCYDAVLENYEALKFVPNKHIDYDICIKAVEQNWKAIEFVPNKLITLEIFECAILQNYRALGKLPEGKRTLDFCKKSISIDGRSLEYVPEEICTKELCLMAIKNNSKALCYLPPKFGREKEILSYERQLGITEIIKKFYDGKYFKVIEKLPHYLFSEMNKENKSNLLETKFDSFDDFYKFVHEDLSDADLRGCEFSNIDLSKYKIENCIIDNNILRKQNLYDDTFYAKNVRLNIHNSELLLTKQNENSEVSIRLDEKEKSSDDEIIYYISDIHLDHKIGKKFPYYATKEEIVNFIAEIIDKMISSLEYYGKLLIIGDVSYQYEICKIFYMELVKKWRASNIIVTIGNHELWNGDTTGLENFEIDEVIKQYRDMLDELGIVFLQNDIFIEQRNGFVITKRLLLHESDILKLKLEDLQKLCEKSSSIYFGGIGFSGYNKNFNAKNGIYRSTLKTVEDDIKQTKRFETIYDKVVTALFRKKVIVMTHMEKSNWSKTNYQSNWIYVSGHTHKNMFEISNEKTIYADNQIGYYTESIKLKHFYLSTLYDTFELYEDGKYVITREQYIDFYHGKGIVMSFSDKLGTIIMLKRCGIYCFIYSLNDRLYLLDGGRKRRLQNDLDYYYENLNIYAQYINSLFKEYNNALNNISKSIKKIGGSGKIHGSIIDIDFYNHIYLNPNDGSVTAYYALSIIDKWVYPNIQELLRDNRKDLYDKYLIEKNLEQSFLQINTKKYIKDMSYVKDTFMYKPSNIIKTLQYTNFNNIVRLWNDDILKLNKKIIEKINL